MKLTLGLGLPPGGSGLSAPRVVLSPDSQPEGTAIGTAIGTLSVVGGSGTYVFAKTVDADGAFTLVAGVLENAIEYEYALATSHTATFTADNGVDPVITTDLTVAVTSLGSGFAAGAIGIWDAVNYQSTGSNPAIPNSVGGTPSLNLFRGSRRLFGKGSGFWTASGVTVTDNAATAPDGSNDASTWVGTGNWFVHPIYSDSIPAGTYTVAMNAKRNTGSDQQFCFTKDNTGSRSSVFTATSVWQRFSYTFTLGAPSTFSFIFPCSIDGTTAANLQVCDLELYSGSSDLGPQTYGGHWYLGKTPFNAVPSHSTGLIDFSGGGTGCIQFATAVSFAAVTVIAAVKKTAAGGSYQALLSSPQSYTNFSHLAEQGEEPGSYFATKSNAIIPAFFEPNGQGWHMVSMRYDGANLQQWIDDIPLFSNSVGAAGPVSLADFWQFANDSNLPLSKYQISAMRLYASALTDVEMVQAYRAMKAQLALSSFTMADTRVLVSEGDSITSPTTPLAYPFVYNNTPPSPLLMGYNNAITGSTIADLNTRAAALDATLPLIRNNRKFILSVLIGANDLLGYSGGNSAWLTALATYCDARRTQGWKVAVCTVTPQTTAGFNTARNIVNPTIRTWVGTHADAIVDFAADATMGTDAAASDTSLYSDGKHPTTAGQVALKAVYAPVINGM